MGYFAVGDRSVAFHDKIWGCMLVLGGRVPLCSALEEDLQHDRNPHVPCLYMSSHFGHSRIANNKQ